MHERFKPHAAVLALLVKDDSILLMRRANTGWADGMYTVPSGHIDKGESVTQAGIREIEEEVGVIVNEANVSFAHVLHRKDDSNGRVYVDFFLLCSAWSGEPTNKELNKCDEVRWCKLNDLPENTVPFVRAAIEAYRSSVYFSETGWGE